MPALIIALLIVLLIGFFVVLGVAVAKVFLLGVAAIGLLAGVALLYYVIRRAMARCRLTKKTPGVGAATSHEGAPGVGRAIGYVYVSLIMP